MAQVNTSRERRNVREISEAYYDPNSPNRQTALNYLSAWYHISVELPPTDPNSFFMIAGYHGMPFRGAGWGNSQWWGGYCHHGNVLFPTWHRAYCWRIENALRTAPNGKDVALAYWDELEDANLTTGLPQIFFEEKVTIPTMKNPDGEEVSNPLHHYTFQKAVWDNLPKDANNPADYSKPALYETCRFPFSGLINETADDQATIKEYNKNLIQQGPQFVQDAFNDRLKAWLKPNTDQEQEQGFPAIGLMEKWKRCLEAPDYTVFSNTTSATQYNEDEFNAKSYGDPKVKNKSLHAIVPLESPHNDGHLMVGGFSIPSLKQSNNPLNPQLSMANGDMGENDTAGFDPIFFHHHCFVDRMFWTWQIQHSSTESFDIRPEYPGTNSVDSQGPTPGIAGNQWLTMDTALTPFKINADNTGDPITSRDVVDISKLGYSYQDLDKHLVFGAEPSDPPTHFVQASGINKGSIAGSFVVASYIDGKLLGYESFLSRWHTAGCSNCQLHLQVKSVIPIKVDDTDVDKVKTIIIPRMNADGNTLLGSNPVPQVTQSVVPVSAATPA